MLILGFGSLKSRDCDMGICTSSYIYTPLSASVSVSVSICICISVSIYRYQYTHLHICDWVLAPLPGGGDVINVREKKSYLCHSLLLAGQGMVSCTPWPKDQYWKQEGGLEEQEGKIGGEREERRK